ncbi:MAG: hypothetical protein QOK42_2730, partial [Frankiaceae bacterium]|nr:hypothetical protein [Frankiaceae bacterium]
MRRFTDNGWRSNWRVRTCSEVP